jgi:hypothetical protein
MRRLNRASQLPGIAWMRLAQLLQEHRTTDDRTRLIELADALDASRVGLSRDYHRGYGDAGDYALRGKLGHIYRDGSGFLLLVSSNESNSRWTNVKKRLRSFCLLTQDGDDEGCFRLDRLPTPEEAPIIREALGIKQKRHYSPEAIAASTQRLRDL